MEIRALRSEDKRADFRSDDPDLDRFFHQFAGQNQFKHHLGVTYVAIEGAAILGFVTVAPGLLEIDGLPIAVQKKLPRHPLPVLRLARLAVDVSARGQKLGTALLRFVLDLALAMADDYGCAGVLVDAKPASVSFYEQYGFFALDPVEGQSAARPQPIAMFLPLQIIARAKT